MSPTDGAFIVLMVLIFQGSQAQLIKSEEWCSTKVLKTLGGELLVERARKFQVECEPGFVTPLSSPSQSYVYQCHHDVLNHKMPQGCVEKRIPYRQVGFQMLLAKTQKTLELCRYESKLRDLALYYNTTVAKADQLLQKHKLYIVNCSTSTFPNDPVRIYAVATKLVKQNISSDLSPGGFAHVILTIFSMLVDYTKELGYLTPDELKSATLIYHSNTSVIGYHCDDHLGLKFDAGEHVCVGCGKGFWMDLHKKCHPCGPGFYNPEETAVECLPCPVQYESGLWSADSIDGCFQTRRIQFSLLSRLLECFVVPFVYLVLLVLVVAVLNRQKRHLSMGRTSRKGSSARSSLALQGKGLTELTTKQAAPLGN